VVHVQLLSERLPSAIPRVVDLVNDSGERKANESEIWVQGVLLVPGIGRVDYTCSQRRLDPDGRSIDPSGSIW